MKVYFHCPSMIPEIQNIFDPAELEKTTVTLQTFIRDFESEYLTQEDTIYLDEGSRMEYITRSQSFRVEGILIHVHPTAKDYPEDPTTVEVQEYIIDGGSVNVGSPTKTWFDKWYDELYRVPRQGNASPFVGNAYAT